MQLLLPSISCTPFILLKGNSVPIEHSLPIPSSPQTLAACILLLSLSFTTRSTSYKWSHAGYLPYWMAYFTKPNVLKVHPHCSMCQNVLPFFRLNSVSSGTTLHFVSSPIHRHLGCCHLWVLWLMLLWTWVYEFESQISCRSCFTQTLQPEFSFHYSAETSFLAHQWSQSR